MDFRRFIGWPSTSHSSSEQLVSTLGGVLSILIVIWSSQTILGRDALLYVVPSMGASAVLIFAVPHSPLAQPWAVFGGHVISACVGVLCATLIPHVGWAAACAVGFAIGAMHVTRSLHPPGGATALSAVIGGTSVQALGIYFPLYPVALNCLVILLIGVIFNSFFPWRRYPVNLMRYHTTKLSNKHGPQITNEHIDTAIAELNVVVDISRSELAEILQRTLQLAYEGSSVPNQSVLQICVGRAYCNDEPGPTWGIRQIVDERPSDEPAFDMVVYDVIAGRGQGRHDSCTRQEFRAWARSEVNAR